MSAFFSKKMVFTLIFFYRSPQLFFIKTLAHANEHNFSVLWFFVEFSFFKEIGHTEIPKNNFAAPEKLTTVILYTKKSEVSLFEYSCFLRQKILIKEVFFF